MSVAIAIFDCNDDYLMCGPNAEKQLQRFGEKLPDAGYDDGFCQALWRMELIPVSGYF